MSGITPNMLPCVFRFFINQSSDARPLADSCFSTIHNQGRLRITADQPMQQPVQTACFCCHTAVDILIEGTAWKKERNEFHKPREERNGPPNSDPPPQTR